MSWGGTALGGPLRAELDPHLHPTGTWGRWSCQKRGETLRGPLRAMVGSQPTLERHGVGLSSVVTPIPSPQAPGGKVEPPEGTESSGGHLRSQGGFSTAVTPPTHSPHHPLSISTTPYIKPLLQPKASFPPKMSNSGVNPQIPTFQPKPPQWSPLPRVWGPHGGSGVAGGVLRTRSGEGPAPPSPGFTPCASRALCDPPTPSSHPLHGDMRGMWGLPRPPPAVPHRRGGPHPCTRCTPREGC